MKATLSLIRDRTAVQVTARRRCFHFLSIHALGAAPAGFYLWLKHII